MAIILTVVYVILGLCSIGETNHRPAERDHVRFYSVRNVADALSVTPKHIFAMIASGKLHSVKLGRRRLVPASELDRIEANLLQQMSGQPDRSVQNLSHPGDRFAMSG